jgi:hypothetical protein
LEDSEYFGDGNNHQDQQNKEPKQVNVEVDETDELINEVGDEINEEIHDFIKSFDENKKELEDIIGCFKNDVEDYYER